MSVISYIVGLLGSMLVGYAIHYRNVLPDSVSLAPIYWVGVIAILAGFAGCVYTEFERVK